MEQMVSTVILPAWICIMCYDDLRDSSSDAGKFIKNPKTCPKCGKVMKYFVPPNKKCENGPRKSDYDKRY
jgi:rubrerythrin